MTPNEIDEGTREQQPLDDSSLRSQAGIGSLLGWQAKGLSVHLVGDHERAGRHVGRILFTVARRRFQELRTAFSEAVT